jgi:hypothetical protein
MAQENKNSDVDFRGVTDEEMILILEMINGGTFSGQGVEVVNSLKQKVLNEVTERKLP